MIITFKNLMSKIRPDHVLCVNNHDTKVWDYKVVDGKLKLIWEPVEGSDNFPEVTCNDILRELLEETGNTDVQIVPETGGSTFKEVFIGEHSVVFSI